MTDLTTLGIAAIRDGVRDGQFKAREVAEAFNAMAGRTSGLSTQVPVTAGGGLDCDSVEHW